MTHKSAHARRARVYFAQISARVPPSARVPVCSSARPPVCAVVPFCWSASLLVGISTRRHLHWAASALVSIAAVQHRCWSARRLRDGATGQRCSGECGLRAPVPSAPRDAATGGKPWRRAQGEATRARVEAGRDMATMRVHSAAPRQRQGRARSRTVPRRPTPSIRRARATACLRT